MTLPSTPPPPMETNTEVHAEVERILAMSDEELLAEVRAEGLDPAEEAERARAILIKAHAAVNARPQPRTQDAPHPMQPIGYASDGVIRFKQNAIIDWLFNTGKLDLNEIAILAAHGKFSAEDQMQIAQLLGYSVSGYGDLSYVTEENLEVADRIVESVRAGTALDAADLIPRAEVVAELRRQATEWRKNGDTEPPPCPEYGMVAEQALADAAAHFAAQPAPDEEGAG